MAYLGLDRTVLWALRGLSRMFVRPTVVPEDARARLAGRRRPLLYVLEERSISDLLALEIACMQRGARRPSKRLKLRALTSRARSSASSGAPACCAAAPTGACRRRSRARSQRRARTRRSNSTSCRSRSTGDAHRSARSPGLACCSPRTGRSSARSAACCRSCSTAAAR